ncbi:TetR/AcrR family transcriptional regulator [Mesobacillus maritimus]|uniref:TetR/AcrR family transcriptional regulator n=1 Tax=Mesobacillus maritimus TaxID=1643336 RepID=UPI00203F5DDE|nr:TetR/AcrR family transcriptional regulator [Mesobacillus maritimus]MCM3670953.1 TetR/AcrR family transcriptional regulator [Mesobacillus maritimus]
MKSQQLTNRQKKALETKKAIFESAISLFKEKGFENVYIDEITSKAGTSKGSFYTYFKSKDEVILEHYKKIDQHYDIVYRALPTELECSTKLLAVLKEGLTFTEKLGHEFLSIVLYSQLSNLDDDSTSIIMSKERTIFQIALQLFEEGKEKGEFDPQVPSEELTEMLLCFYKGLYLDWCLSRGKFPFIEKGEKQLKSYIRSLTNVK